MTRSTPALIAASAILAFAPASATARAGGHVITGNIDFEDDSCQQGPPRTLAGAKVVAHRSGETGRGTVGPTGDYEVKFKHGHGPATASLVLDGPTVTVAPSKKHGPYSLALDTIHPGAHNADVLTGKVSAAAANIFSVASTGADVADLASPVRIPEITVAWPANKTVYRSPEKTSFLEEDVAWIPAAILHEYGHHLFATAAFNGNWGGLHLATKTYPEDPTMPLNESIADVFAAVALGGPVLNQYCDVTEDLSTTPATTSEGPVDEPRLAQYNETRDGGAFWHLAAYFGAGDMQEGLRRIVFALHSWEERHVVAPKNMRQVRDSLIAGGLQTNEDQHEAINSILADQGIGWGVKAYVQIDDAQEEGSGTWYEIHLVLEGPYGRCEVTGNDGSMPGEEKSPPVPTDGGGQWYGSVVKGALPYTSEDDCLVAGGDGRVSQDANDRIEASLLWLRFPFTTNGGHLYGDNDFTLTARYVCANNHPERNPDDTAPSTCTSDREASVIVENGVADPVTATITLHKDVDTPVLTFDGRGGCKLANGTDCKV
jgi:hypothetical protein